MSISVVRVHAVAEPSDNQTALTNVLLAALVPMRYAEIARMSNDDRAFLAERCADAISQNGDALPGIRSKDMDGKSVLSNIVTGLALGARLPAGVELFGVHYCIDGSGCDGRDWQEQAA